MIERVPVKDPRAVMPIRAELLQEREHFNGSVERLGLALDRMAESTRAGIASIARTWGRWKDALEDAGVELPKGVHYGAPVIIDDPPPLLLRTRTPIKPPPKWVREQIGELSGRVLAELGPGPGRDA